MILCSKCRHVEIKKGICYEPCEEIETYLRNRLNRAESLIHSIAEWTDNEKLEEECLKFLDGR